VDIDLDTTELNDEQLAAEAAREGSDGPAFVALLERYQDRVWRVCYRLMGNVEDANDAAQEVFVRLFLQRAKFAGRSKYATWVHGITIRTCLSLRRSHGRRRRHESAAGSAESHKQEQCDRHDDAATALDLLQMLETLDDEDRALLIMKYAERRNYEELADMFNLSVSACKMRISRARDKLKSRFPDHSFGGDERS